MHLMLAGLNLQLLLYFHPQGIVRRSMLVSPSMSRLMVNICFFRVRLGSLPLVLVAGSYGGCVHWTQPFLDDLVYHISPLGENSWNRKRLSSFLTFLIRQILPLLTTSYFRGSKNTLMEENIKREKISVRLYSSVWTVCFEKIMKTH
jgi:hypothetical protein